MASEPEQIWVDTQILDTAEDHTMLLEMLLEHFKLKLQISAQTREFRFVEDTDGD